MWNRKENLIFGLDIGTRTIIGIVGYQQNDKFVIVASQVIEHESRAMIDGQIHDILAVARGVDKIKNLLESEIGFQLKEVAIAAAGRVLKTIRVNVEQRFKEVQQIDSLTIKSLELQGIQEAQRQIKQNAYYEGSDYFFVGHSVIQYYLNEYGIANLEGQKGKQVGADILATFLPKVVVDSLYTVMDRVGLKVTNITLEPIAAMNTVIPPNLRLLNLALIDIGAGTSDIAIAKEGSVVAYGMIPQAGDEITEKLVHTYLVDFETAEKIKRQLITQRIVEFEDIIGTSHRVLAEDIVETLNDTINELVREVSSKIIELNGNKSPNAVFCVGGGSQTAHITKALAEQLSLPIERVALRSSNHAVGVIDDMKKLTGPESITPLGICLTAMEKQDNNFIEVTINDQKAKLLHTKRLTIADAILEVGYDHNKIIAKRGKTLMFRLNGQRIRIKGESGEHASIICNGQDAALETDIKNGDEIYIHPAADGKDGQASIISLIGQVGLSKEEAIVTVNDTVVDEFYVVQEGDNIDIQLKKEESDVALQEHKMFVIVNDEVVEMPYKTDHMFVSVFDYINFDLSTPKGSIILKLNGSRAAYTDILKDGDKLEIYWEE